MAFFVVYGYCGPDNYTSDGGPILKVKECATESIVLALKKSFDAESRGKDNSDHVFRVIEGLERRLQPKTTVTEYEIK